MIDLVRRNATGGVEDATVVAFLPNDGFNEAVMSALRRAKFDLLDPALQWY